MNMTRNSSMHNVLMLRKLFLVSVTSLSLWVSVFLLLRYIIIYLTEALLIEIVSQLWSFHLEIMTPCSVNSLDMFTTEAFFSTEAIYQWPVHSRNKVEME